MHDELVAALRYPSVASALIGQQWVDENYDSGSRDHRMYSGFVILMDRYPKSWWSYYAAHIVPEICTSYVLPSDYRIKRAHLRLEAIWRELGFT